MDPAAAVVGTIAARDYSLTECRATSAAGSDLGLALNVLCEEEGNEMRNAFVGWTDYY